jgi:hypothetical protein
MKIKGQTVALAWVVALIIAIILVMILPSPYNTALTTVVWLGWTALFGYWALDKIGLINQLENKTDTSSASSSSSTDPATTAAAPAPSAPKQGEGESDKFNEDLFERAE